MYRLLLISVGLLACGAGILGIFLPLLPTTPFLLLATWCFCQSSPRLHQWLLTHPWFGHYLKQYQEQRAIPRHAKVLALLMLWSSMGYLITYVIQLWWLRLLLLTIASAVSLYLLSLQTLTTQQSKCTTQG